ncbi:MAG: hypothetical protein KDC41_15260 [Saprospiraceae bacterium]|nr:hypothetical protein [Saprospiraceae bacterium]
MQFAEVVGQRSVVDSLLRMVSSERIPHALLFLGPEGCGKLTLALALARYLLCERPSAGDCCNECSACLKTGKWIHPDLHFSIPTVGPKATSEAFLIHWRQALAENPYQNVNQWLQRIGAENKQGNITKEECVNIVRKLSLKTVEGRYKILIMWLPEYLGKEGNRLLKLIEEPPADTFFFLVAERQELILNTILSRCQLVHVQPLPDELVAEAVQAYRPLSAAQAQTVAYLADGNLNEARNLVDQAESDQSDRFLDWLRKCYVGKAPALMEWVESFAAVGRENQKHLLRYGLHFLRELVLLKATGREEVRLRPAERETATRLQALVELDQLERIINLLSDCAYHVERNAHPKVLFLDASIRIHHIFQRSGVPAGSS